MYRGIEDFDLYPMDPLQIKSLQTVNLFENCKYSGFEAIFQSQTSFIFQIKEKKCIKVKKNIEITYK